MRSAAFPHWIRTSAGPYDLFLEWQRESVPASPLWYDLQILRQKWTLNYPSRNWKETAVWNVPWGYYGPFGRQSHRDGLMRPAETWLQQSRVTAPGCAMVTHRAAQCWTTKGRIILLNWIQDVGSSFSYPVFEEFHSMKASNRYLHVWFTERSGSHPIQQQPLSSGLILALHVLWLYLEHVACDVQIARGLHVKITTRKHARHTFYHCATYLVKCFTVSMLFVWCSLGFFK